MVPGDGREEIKSAVVVVALRRSPWKRKKNNVAKQGQRVVEEIIVTQICHGFDISIGTSS